MQDGPTPNGEGIWIALVGAAASILGALRADKWPVYFFDWLKGLGGKNKRKELEARQEALIQEIRKVKQEQAAERMNYWQMKYTVKAMLPLMKKIMKQTPEHVELLEQLENSILSGSAPTDKWGPKNGNEGKSREDD